VIYIHVYTSRASGYTSSVLCGPYCSSF